MVAIINRRWRRSVIGTLLLVIVACAAGGSGLPAAAAPGVGRRAQTAFALYVPASPRAVTLSAGPSPTPVAGVPSPTAVPTATPAPAGASATWLPNTTQDGGYAHTYSTNLAVDAAGGLHVTYSIYIGQDAGHRPAYYAYCPSQCGELASWHRASLGDGVVRRQNLARPAAAIGRPSTTRGWSAPGRSTTRAAPTSSSTA